MSVDTLPVYSAQFVSVPDWDLTVSEKALCIHVSKTLREGEGNRSG